MKHVRHGRGAVRPYLHAPWSVVEFLKTSLGARELERHPFSPESAHVELAIQDSIVVIEAGPLPPEHPGWTGSIYVYVPDVDAVWADAMRAGMTPVAEPADKPYGERQAGFRDPMGNTWWVATLTD